MGVESVRGEKADTFDPQKREKKQEKTIFFTDLNRSLMFPIFPTAEITFLTKNEKKIEIFWRKVIGQKGRREVPMRTG